MALVASYSRSTASNLKGNLNLEANKFYYIEIVASKSGSVFLSLSANA
jgi:hypothetical protein